MTFDADFKRFEPLSGLRCVIVRYVTASDEEMKKVFRGVISFGVVDDFVCVVGLNGQTFYFQKSRVASLDCCCDGEYISEVERREGYVEFDLKKQDFEG